MNSGQDEGVIVVRALGELFFFFGLLGWLYGVVDQFLHPQSLTYPLSHLTPLRVDTFTVLCFVISAIGFLMWRLTTELGARAK